MIALGNDVVDLNEVPRNGERYYQRLIQSAFIPEELDDLPAHLSLQLKCALLWSAKEAAFKSIKKLKLVSDFTPKDIHVRFLRFDLSEAIGRVHAYGTDLHLRVAFNENWVHTLTQLRDDLLEASQVVACDANYLAQFTEVRNAALRDFAMADEVAKSTEGVPILKARGKKLSNELSLSHHGHFAAYAIGL
jgi:phosphopantetheinyl transferase (holo-ACP synthase)